MKMILVICSNKIQIHNLKPILNIEITKRCSNVIRFEAVELYICSYNLSAFMSFQMAWILRLLFLDTFAPYMMGRQVLRAKLWLEKLLNLPLSNNHFNK